MLDKFLHLIIPIVIFTIVTNLVFGQTGPGGVGNSSSNKIWLDAAVITSVSSGTPIATWPDRSGNGWSAIQNTASNRPSYITGIANGLPAINFNRSLAYQFLRITNGGVGAIMSNSNSIFVVCKANSGSLNSSGTGNLQCIFDVQGYHSGVQYLGYPTTNNFFTTQFTGGSVPGTPKKQIETYSSTSQNSWTIFNKLSVETGNNTTLKSFVNGMLTGSVMNALAMTNYHDLVVMGATAASGDYAWPLNGDIAEAIVFSINLNEAQRIIVDNYLSAKYNISIQGDYYTNHESDFTLDVQGIGTTDGSLNKHAASGNGKGLWITEINESLDSLNEFLFCGHNSVGNSTVSLDIPLVVQNRWQRVWCIQKTGSVDAKISFDFSDSGITSSVDLGLAFSNFRLLFRPSSATNFAVVQADNVPVSPILEGGDRLSFSIENGVLLDGYYTIGYAPSIVWTGSVNSNWNAPGNWNLNRVPSNGDMVVVNTCSTCPVLAASVIIGGLILGPGSSVNLGNNILSVTGSAFLNQCLLGSESGGSIHASDFIELKNSVFEGPVKLEKTGGRANNCYGGNTFSSELEIVNSSTNTWQLSANTQNVISN